MSDSQAEGTSRASALAALKQRSSARLAHLPAAREPPKVLEKEVTALSWICQTCNRECLPIRSESRCLCGHRLREHAEHGTKCSGGRGCPCKAFFYIVAEGSWILRCRCKHKHIEHDPVTHKCTRPKCECPRFDSPWVCNCDHPWSDHRQVTVRRTVKDLASVQPESGGLEIAPDVNRWDKIQRGLPPELHKPKKPVIEEL